MGGGRKYRTSHRPTQDKCSVRLQIKSKNFQPSGLPTTPNPDTNSVSCFKLLSQLETLIPLKYRTKLNTVEKVNIGEKLEPVLKYSRIEREKKK